MTSTLVLCTLSYVIHRVIISKWAKKQLLKVPSYIVDKLDTWVQTVEKEGLEVVRRISGYHDESLKGNRQGQRSIRLSRSYRAIYVVKGNEIEFAEIEEVTKHEY